jgi:fructose-1,6-bisphosphatase/inositol monophosphatase family enzyme
MSGPEPDVDDLGRLLDHVADQVAGVVESTSDWDVNDPDRGQYRVDLAADAAAVPLLTDAGLGVLSEESGRHHPERALTAVIDPLDGTTNASRGLPWCATSICVIDEVGPLVALVADLAHGHRFRAVRGGGAARDGQPIAPAAPVALSEAIVGLADLPPRRLGWGQYRSLGALALDLCAVADGRLDAYIDCGVDAHGPWDFLGGLLVCREAGAMVADARDRDLVVLGHGDRRTPVAASSPVLQAECLAARSTFS